MAVTSLAEATKVRLVSLQCLVIMCIRLTACVEAGVHVAHVETGEHVYTFKSAGNSPVVSWAPTKYSLAFSDATTNALRIVGVDTDRK